MSLLLLKLTLAPGLVAATTLAARRWGPQVAGWLGGLPVVVGPILLALTLEQGSAFATEAAAGALLGLASLCAFVLAYAWTARAAPWPAALGAGWLAFAAVTLPLDTQRPGPLTAFVAVGACFALTDLLLPRLPRDPPPPPPPPFDLSVRAGTTAVVVLTLTALAGILGPHLSGLLAAFPVLASVLAGFTHRQAGPSSAVGLLRGLSRGLVSFALFCFLVALLLPGGDVALAFGVATLAALGAHAAGRVGVLAIGRRRRSLRAREAAGVP